MRYWLLLVLLVTGCDKEVQRVQMDIRQEPRTVSCTIRTYDCSGMRYNVIDQKVEWETETCSDYGKQDAIAEVTQYRSRYKSGTIKDWSDEKITQLTSACR